MISRLNRFARAARTLGRAGLCAVAVGALVAGCGSGSSSSTGARTSGATGTSSAAGATTGGGTSTQAGTTASSSTGTSSASGAQMGFEGVPLQQGPQLAPATTTGSGTVDGIKCQTNEQLVYHIHAHLAVFDDGKLYAVPAGVGIPDPTVQQTNVGPVVGSGKCFYWLHTHTTDGVIHIESPSKRIYTLGDFFDVWHQPLSSKRIAGLQGSVTALVNGKPWHRSPRDIPLLSHADIQLEIGQPAPPVVKIDWSKTQL